MGIFSLVLFIVAWCFLIGASIWLWKTTGLQASVWTAVFVICMFLNERAAGSLARVLDRQWLQEFGPLPLVLAELLGEVGIAAFLLISLAGVTVFLERRGVIRADSRPVVLLRRVNRCRRLVASIMVFGLWSDTLMRVVVLAALSTLW